MIVFINNYYLYVQKKKKRQKKDAGILNSGVLSFIPLLYSHSKVQTLIINDYRFMPQYTFSAVTGNSLTLTPTALATASAMAGEGVLITISPMDLAPKGPVAHSCFQIPPGYRLHPAW